MATIPELLTQLRSRKQAFAELEARAAPILGELERAVKACTAAASAELETEAQGHANEIRELGGLTAAGWDSGFWTDFQGDAPALLAAIRIGRSIELNLLDGEQGIHGMPAVVPFLASTGPLLIMCDANSQGQARMLMQNILLRTVVAMPGEIRYTLIDQAGNGEAFPLLELLPNVRQEKPGQALVDKLLAISSDISRVEAGAAARSRLNELSPQDRAGEKFELIAAVDFPDEFRDDLRAADLLVKVGNRGPKTGRYLLLEVCADKQMPPGFDIDRFENAQVIDLRNGQASVLVDTLPDEADEDRLIAAALKTSIKKRTRKRPTVSTATAAATAAAKASLENGANNGVKAHSTNGTGASLAAMPGPGLMPSAVTAPSPNTTVAPAVPRRATKSLKTSAKPSAVNAEWRPSAFFAETAQARMETPIGEPLSIALGETAAHALIAGRNAAERAALLHAMILGLASRYSPDELQFYLIGGKDGAEFAAYRNLPHARVVCLETSPEMARCVLDDFAAEMRDRLAQFKAEGEAGSLEKYRAASGKVLPRIILLAEGYQHLLTGDAERGAQLLAEVLEKGGAGGTHLVLASETLDMHGLPAAVASHLHVRVALPLPAGEVEAADAFGAEGKKLIGQLASTGEAVVNHDSGADGANKRGTFARLTDATEGADALTEAVAEIARHANAAPARQVAKTIVLRGRETAVLADNPYVLLWRTTPPAPEVLQKVAQTPARLAGFGIEHWSAEEKPVPLWLGRKFDTYGHALAMLRRVQGSNLMMLGTNARVRLASLASALAGLVAMAPVSTMELDIIDAMPEGAVGENLLRTGADAFQSRGGKVRFARPDQIEQMLERLATEVARRHGGASANSTIVLVISEPEHISGLHIGEKGVAPSPLAEHRHFRELLQRGSRVGVHVVLTASDLTAVARVLNPARELRNFAYRAVQTMSEEDSTKLFGGPLAARIGAQADHPAATLLVDIQRNPRSGVLYMAYAASATDVDGGAADLEAQLRALLG